MKDTLRSRYKEKQTTLSERYEEKKVLKRIIAESAQELILEKTDNKAQTANVINKLRKMGETANVVGCEELYQSIVKASSELNKFSGGGAKAVVQQSVAAIQKKLGAKAGSNPLLKCELLLSSLEQGFEIIPKVLKKYIKDYDEKSAESPLSQCKKMKGKETSLIDAVQKAFVPTGFYSKVLSYVKDPQYPAVPYLNLKKLSQSLLELDSEYLTSIIEVVTSSKVSVAAEQEVKAAIQTAKTGENSSTKNSFFANLFDKVMARPELRGADKDTVKKVLSVIDDFRSKGASA